MRKYVVTIFGFMMFFLAIFVDVVASTGDAQPQEQTQSQGDIGGVTHEESSAINNKNGEVVVKFENIRRALVDFGCEEIIGLFKEPINEIINNKSIDNPSKLNNDTMKKLEKAKVIFENELDDIRKDKGIVEPEFGKLERGALLYINLIEFIKEQPEIINKKIKTKNGGSWFGWNVRTIVVMILVLFALLLVSFGVFFFLRKNKR